MSASFTLLPFKTGAVRMAAAAGVPVVPCVIWGSHRVMTRSRPTSLWRARRTPVTILIGEPVHVRPDDQPEVATEALRARMVQLLEQAMDSYPDAPGPGAWWVPSHRGGGAPPAGREDLEAV